MSKIINFNHDLFKPSNGGTRKKRNSNTDVKIKVKNPNREKDNNKTTKRALLKYIRSQQEKNYEKSIKTLEKAIAIAPSDLIKSQILFQCGYLYFTLKNFDKMINYLERSIACKQTHLSSYNLLAYYYAQENKYLDKALALINIALQKNPSCYYFLDTKGCILLKLGKKQEAQLFLQKALQQAPHDKIIQDHLAQASN